jgi:membrane protein implicated in regulation of membrane protease activity
LKRPSLPPPAAWLLSLAGGALSLGCLIALVRFGFRWVLAWWLALSLSAAYAGWSLTRDQDADRGGL